MRIHTHTHTHTPYTHPYTHSLRHSQRSLPPLPLSMCVDGLWALLAAFVGGCSCLGLNLARPKKAHTCPLGDITVVAVPSAVAVLLHRFTRPSTTLTPPPPPSAL